jgi:hypothetical protein
MSENIVSDEKAVPVPVSSEAMEVGKVERLLDDEAGSLAARAIVSGEPDPVQSKEVLRKIDWHILPFLCVTYGKLERSTGPPPTTNTCTGLMYLDKSTLSSASIFGIIEDNKLVGQDYAWARYASFILPPILHPLTHLQLHLLLRVSVLAIPW